MQGNSSNRIPIPPGSSHAHSSPKFGSFGSSFGSPTEIHPLTSQSVNSFSRLSPFSVIKIPQWVDDRLVENCFVCEQAFTFFNRKHHCRYCGRVICHACSRYGKIPSILEDQIPQPDSQPRYLHKILRAPTDQRLCVKCHTQINRNMNAVPCIKVLLNLCRQGLVNMTEWKQLVKVSVAWYNASMFLISRLNQIIRYLPFQSLSRDEKALVSCNRLRLLEKFPRIVARVPMQLDQAWTLTVQLPIPMSLESALEILLHHDKTCHSIVYSSAIEAVTRSTWDNLRYYQVAMVKLPPMVLGQVLDHLGLTDLFEFYWILRRFSPTIARDLVASHGLLRQEVHRSETLLSLLQDLANAATTGKRRGVYEKWQSRRRDVDDDFYRVPGMWRLKVVGVKWSHTVQKKSSTRPTIFTLVCVNRHGQRCLHRIMLKQEDVLNDYVAQWCASLLSSNVEGQDFSADAVVTYDVVPLSSKNGLIYIVSRCKTLWDVCKTFSVQNFLIEHNTREHIHMIRRRFLQSCAFQTVLSFLLGTGDRHLQNVMLTFEGSLFNIDFGYIFGQETVHRVTQSNLKLTPEMLDALGGKHSSDYARFTRCCKSLFRNVRANVLGYVLLLHALVVFGNVDFSSFRSHIINRFGAGESDTEANIRIITSIKRHSSEYYNTIESIYDKIFDFRQRYF